MKTDKQIQSTAAMMETINLTRSWVREMMERLPALEQALSEGSLLGASPSLDLKCIRAALEPLGYFAPSVPRLAHPMLGELKAKLAKATAAPTVPNLLPQVWGED